MGKPRLNPVLLEKLANKTGKSKQYLREQISRKAGRLGISSTATQVVWAKDQGIGVTRFLNKLPQEVREEVRSVSSMPSFPRRRVPATSGARSHPRKTEPITAATIDSLLQDEQLRARCKDLLRARGHFDRVFREATTVLDDRLKKKSGIKHMNPADLVGKVINPDPQKAVLVVSSDRAEQEGFHAVCKGVMLGFRNIAHHALSDKISREDALKFGGFVDMILGIIEQANIHPERI
jgi:hypothetical protein